MANKMQLNIYIANVKITLNVNSYLVKVICTGDLLIHDFCCVF